MCMLRADIFICKDYQIKQTKFHDCYMFYYYMSIDIIIHLSISF